jgi:hypothetical protein
MKKKALTGGLIAVLLVATAACSQSGTTNTTTTNTTTTSSNTTNRSTQTNTSTTSNTSNTTPTNTSDSTSSAGGKQDFTLHNATGVEIDELYVAPHSDEEWAGDEDILGRDTLPNGQSVDIIFSPKEKAARWDMKIVDTNGTTVEWNDLNLMEISEITLRYDGGRATAEVK